MSHDLFAAGGHDTRVRARRSSVFVVSFVLHLAALAAAVVATFLLPEVLPQPHSSVVYAVEGPRMVRLTDIALTPRPSPSAARTAAPIATRAPAPIEAPSRVDAEPAGASAPGGSDLGHPDGLVSSGALPGLVTGATLEPPPSPPSSQSSAPVRLHAGIEPPRKVNEVAPVYPALARTTGVHGVVIIEATIDTQGTVVAARVLRSVPMLDEAALDAVRQWRYAPARLNGAPTAVLITVTVNFTLAAR